MAEQVLDSIDHVALSVASISQSVQWYQTSFNCRVLVEERTFAVLQFENLRVTLVLPSQQPPHIAFARADAATLGELREQVDGIKSTFISDPTGNPIEILSSGTE